MNKREYLNTRRRHLPNGRSYWPQSLRVCILPVSSLGHCTQGHPAEWGQPPGQSGLGILPPGPSRTSSGGTQLLPPVGPRHHRRLIPTGLRVRPPLVQNNESSRWPAESVYCLSRFRKGPVTHKTSKSEMPITMSDIWIWLCTFIRHCLVIVIVAFFAISKVCRNVFFNTL